jgi:hypothetical protein
MWQGAQAWLDRWGGQTVRVAGTRRQRRVIEQAASKYGIAPSTLYGVWGAETGFRRDATSPAGAQGPFQFMPATAESYGIDPHNFRQAANGAAKYLSTYKDRGLAGMLAAYNAGPAGDPRNAETQAYIPRVKQFAQEWPGGPSGGGAGSGGASARIAVDGGSGASQGLAALLGQLDTHQRPQIQSSGLQAPSFAAGPTLPTGYQAPSGGGGPVEQQRTGLADLLGQVSQLQGPQAEVMGDSSRALGGGGAAEPGPAAALQFASRRLGTTETAGANRGKLIDKWEQSFGTLGQPWCGIFVGKALQRAGVQGIDSRVASTAAIVDMARKGDGGFAGLVSARQTQPGDVVVWDPGANGHTGIVEKVAHDGSVTVIEGNSSNGVRRRVHPKSGAFYARPAYQ